VGRRHQHRNAYRGGSCRQRRPARREQSINSRANVQNGHDPDLPPTTEFTASWEYGGAIKWSEGRGIGEGLGGRRLELQHIAHIDDHGDQFVLSGRDRRGSGLVGLGSTVPGESPIRRAAAVDGHRRRAPVMQSDKPRVVHGRRGRWGRPRAGTQAAERTTAAYLAGGLKT